MIKISDINVPCLYQGTLVIKNVTNGLTNNKQKYLSFTLQDNSGTIEAKKWNVEDDEINMYKPKDFVNLSGDVIEYKDKFQIKVTSMEKVDPNLVDPTQFAIACPSDVAALSNKLKAYIDSIENIDVRSIVNLIIDKFYEKYISYPAACVVHHAHIGGILLHSVTMCDVAESLTKIYSGINRDYLIAGTILHDVGKTIELSGPLATEYTIKGKLFGHISIMFHEIMKASEQLNITSEVPDILGHMVLSHHGEMEFGSPVNPITIDAFALHMIDDLDAKMNIIGSALKNVEEGQLTDRLNFINGQCFYKPYKTK